MKIIMFYHSLYSDWNHGNAHFLRGIVRELQQRGNDVEVYEPEGGWSLNNLIKDHGAEKMDEFRKYYPGLSPQFYNPSKQLNYEGILRDADLVIVHEWNDPQMVANIGKQKEKYGFKLLFHDTHHRAASAPEEMGKYDFSNYDAALVFGEVIKNIYLENKWISNVFTWHEAADAELFKPVRDLEKEGDLVWIGNWGDNERTEELMEFLIEPVKELKLKAKVYGVRYPEKAKKALADAGIEYGGWLPNYKVPEVFSRYKLTVHVPRRPYVEMLPGIPTIRPFEALSCGIPLICSPWQDAENLFTPGEDYLLANDGNEMGYRIAEVLKSAQLAQSLSQNGRKTILARHTCAHRVDELEEIITQINKQYPYTQKSGTNG
ncbi:glycosyltransferase [Antarcticibacterium flavum]|uniref:Glycosyltransferase n=1 Tax=Antarcticibacterium flavum TaxID=2058175 RepID=A0A5B7X1W1_9FLAO|nr:MULTISPECIES: glycosyltransferase [Antarcticibacterium]MCM4161443.1 glycosyltransferase [Antarcticibacterium sp. W02-3]QCY69319.1 glycosyltransferase [Antarcticibacterium flavum]